MSATAPRGRVGPALASAALVAYWAFVTAYGQFDIDLPGTSPERDPGPVIAVFALVLAVAVGLYVARWWLLAAVLTPVIVLGLLELGGHRGPWESSGPPLTVLLWWPLLWGLTWFCLVPLVLGIAMRRGLGERPRGRPASADPVRP